MSGPPVISVIMPVFNGAAWLAESLASVRRQQVAGLELIVVDDGSTDGSAAVLRACAPEATYFRQENRGPSAARNAGLDRARAGLIAFLDQDDLWPDGSLEVRLQALQADARALFVLGRTRFLFAGPGQDTAPWVSPNLGAGLYRREVFARLGRFNEATRLTDDVEWSLRLREAGLPYVTLSEETLHYRRGTGGVTSGRTWRDAELLATVRESLARRRQAGGPAQELPLLSGARQDPRATGPVNHDHGTGPKN